MSWGAVAGAQSYNVYRNGVLLTNVAGTSYTDNAATASNDPTWATPCEVYFYAVAAVINDVEGAKSTQLSCYGYQNGASNWSNGDLSYGGAVPNYAGNMNGVPCVSVSFPGGGWQPTADAPQFPEWDAEVGAFNFFTIDINPGATVGYAASLGVVSRLPPGDVFNFHSIGNIFAYGPAPQPNTWATYKVPFSALGLGKNTFTGSIAGNVLTVTTVEAGGTVDASGFVTGPGVPAGTYILGYNQSDAIGTFTLGGPGVALSVPSEQMTFQRTSVYKFAIQPGAAGITMGFNNFGFTAQ